MNADHSEKMRLLVSLCRELSKLGLPAVMSDARPALSVCAGLVKPRMWISVSACGEFFEWCAHPAGRLVASDPEGAAERIANHLRTNFGG